MPQLAINTAFLDPRRQGGAETYVRMLIDHLQRIVPADGDEQFIIPVGRGSDLNLHHRQFEPLPCRIDPAAHKRRILYEELLLPRQLHRLNLDLVHFPYSAAPRRYRGRALVTMHDTLRFVYPAALSRLELAYRRYIDAHLQTGRPHVICVSHDDAGRLMNHLNLPADQVSVVYHGVDESFTQAGAVEVVKGNYVLWVGRPYAHKNLNVLLRAYGLLRSRNRAVPTLRLVGVSPTERAGVQAAAERAGAGDCVSIEPQVPHDQLPRLFAEALLFCYPSACESFGLPVIEAMASGTAVLCSDLPVFHELHDSAPVYAPADSPEAFADALDRLVHDEPLRRRHESLGRSSAARFTWHTCARNTLAVYRRLVGR